MRGNVRHTQSMSQHGKKQLSAKETQTKFKSQSIYDTDGMLSTVQHQEIKMSMTLPPLPSMADNFLNREWRKYALCKGKTPLFFRHRCSIRCAKHKKGCDRVRVVRDCKAICASCPVLEHCRTWAIETNLLKGVAGGQTESERKEAIKLIKGENYDEEYTDDYC